MEDYKEKYEEALERAKLYHKGHTLDINPQAAMEYIFPELKESEDEKIRKAIEEAVEHYWSDDTQARTNIFSWLEKQDKKDSQVILPTFTFDDILALQCCMKKVQKDEELYNQLQILHDRLHDAYWLEKQGEQKPAEDSCKTSDDSTTEEKDMTEYNKGFECGKQRVLKYPEDFNLCEKSASAWSEEDEARYYGVIETEQYVLDVVNGRREFSVGNEQIRKECIKELDWLKSLKERYTWKPSDEQMKALLSKLPVIKGGGDNARYT